MPNVKEPTILLADDNAIRTGLAAALQRGRFHVLEAHDGREALKLIETYAPDVVVLDIMMPVMDGREVCRRLRQAGN